MGNAVVVDVFKGEGWITSVASEVFTLVAGEEDLWGQIIIGESSLSGDLDSVSKRRGGGKSPAGTAVLWDVLVSDQGEIIDTINVGPEMLGGEFLLGELLELSKNLGRLFLFWDRDVLSE